MYMYIEGVSFIHAHYYYKNVDEKMSGHSFHVNENLNFT